MPPAVSFSWATGPGQESYWRGSQNVRGTLAAAEAALTTPVIGCDLDTAQHVYTC